MRNPESIRADQEQQGRQMSRDDNVRTLRVPEHKRSTGTDAPRRKFVPKGHDAILAAAQEAKKPVLITTMAGETFHGVIVARDKFTITLHTGEHGITFYKHAVESFTTNTEADPKSGRVA